MSLNSKVEKVAEILYTWDLERDGYKTDHLIPFDVLSDELKQDYIIIAELVLQGIKDER